jgi:rhomboid family GlyGly-CTERM serine protease
LNRASAAWVALAGLLALCAMGGALAPADWQAWIDWQPGRAGAEPWRAFTAVMLHYSPLHLLANLAGTAAVGALGVSAKLPLRSTVAWAVAWPLTQLGLLAQPALLHYGGLSGVLHAGVAVAALHLVLRAQGRRRAIGIALMAGLVIKLLTETPWGEPLRRPVGWDIAIAPFAHASGAAAGLLLGGLAEAWHGLSNTRKATAA